MKLKIAFGNKTREFKLLEDKLKAIHADNTKKVCNKLLVDLKNETPVDTGHARDSWSLALNEDKATISNTAEYIEYLNNGSSKQAPAYFIESTALKYGTPKGAIVETE